MIRDANGSCDFVGWMEINDAMSRSLYSEQSEKKRLI